MKYKKGLAYICHDSPELGEPSKYECIYDRNDRWNGWHMPLFTKEVFDSIIEDTHINIIRTTREGIFITDYDEDGIAGTRVVDGKTYYEFYGWIWECEDYDKK